MKQKHIFTLDWSYLEYLKRKIRMHMDEVDHVKRVETVPLFSFLRHERDKGIPLQKILCGNHSFFSLRKVFLRIPRNFNVPQMRGGIQLMKWKQRLETTPWMRPDSRI
jgi:hypothetical protein